MHGQWEVPGGYATPAFGSVSEETIQETSEIFVLTDVEKWISQFINNGWPITINGAGLFAKHVSHFYACPNPGPRGKLPRRSKASRKPLIGSKWTLSAGAKTRERFQEGVPLRPLGLSQWKLSRRRVRFSSLVTLMGKFPGYQQWLICNQQ